MIAALEILLIFGAVGVFASAKSFQPAMVGGVFLMVVALLIHWGRRGRPLSATRLDWPFILLLGSGVISLWASYDVWASLAKFCLLLGGILLFYLLTQATLQIRLSIAASVVAFTVLFSIFFVTQQNEFLESGTGSKFPVFADIGLLINRVSPQFDLYQFHPNVAAGILEVGLVLGVGLFLLVRQLAKQSDAGYFRLVPPLLVGTLAIIAIGLIITGSRGAWLATGLVGLGWFLSEVRRASRLRVFDTLAIVIIIGSLLALLMAEIGSPIALAAGTGEAASSGSRLTIYQGANQLVRDYIFTGGGLATFPLHYSTYVLGIEVVQQNHAHNLYLSVWLEQGLLGFVALLWLIYSTITGYVNWQKREVIQHRENPLNERFLGAASFWATSVIFIHGLIDSAHYNSRFLPLLFISLGVGTYLHHWPGRRRKKSSRRKIDVERWIRSHRVGLIVGILLLVPIIVVGQAPLRAAWYANLGAVA
ncbi:MAG: O-antigen ligase family protein, partial [Anaerolineae bacterium]|nr:O-antigen ligase family protein [Anaerolineae bacterium]